jgi:K+-transporting ATPase KdpF subunit
MDDMVGMLEAIHRAERQGIVLIVQDDDRSPDDRLPMTIQIVGTEMGQEAAHLALPPHPLVRVIHEGDLARMAEEENSREIGEEESMTFGEGVTLLIAIGVLMYLIYALLWPERF